MKKSILVIVLILGWNALQATGDCKKNVSLDPCGSAVTETTAVITNFSRYNSDFPLTKEQNTAENDTLITGVLGMVRGDSLLAYMQALQDFETRFALAPNRKEVAEWIMEKFLSFGITEVKLDSFLCYTGFGYDTLTWQYNVEAKITGSDYPEHEIIIMGHYDSMIHFWEGDPMTSAPGANDNASGTAAALESARVIMESGYQPDKTVVFLATAAEELMGGGDSGAKHYALEAYNTGRKLGMVINNDMIAWNDGTFTLSIRNHDDSPHITSMAIDIIDEYTSLNYVFSSTGGSFADLTPFLDLGFHGIWFMENTDIQFYPYYHTVNDVTDHLDTTYHAEMTRAGLGLMLRYDQIHTDAALLTVSNIPNNICINTLSPHVTIANYGSEPLTSMEIVCTVNGLDTLTFAWTGNTPFLETALVELPEFSFTLLPENELLITLQHVNGDNDQITVNNTINASFVTAPVTPSEIKLMIWLDGNPHETSWEVKDSAGDILYSGGPYSIPNGIISENFNFDEPGCYVFTIYDSGGNGLQPPASVLVYYGTNTVLFQGNTFGNQAQTQFEIGGISATGTSGLTAQFLVYPNPALNQAVIEFELNAAQQVEAAVYNLAGQRLFQICSGKYDAGKNRLIFNTSTLDPGLYIIKARFGDSTVARLFVRQ